MVKCNTILLKKGLTGLFFVFSFYHVNSADSKKILINEFMAINDNTLADKYGDYPDWIELYNPGSTAVNLLGWYLTDNPANLTKWQFPEIIIPAGGYLIVFASEKNLVNPDSALHTNFKLSGSGEFLALIEPDETFSSSFQEGFPYQKADVSYGLFSDQYTYIQPTPGSINTAGTYIFPPLFNINRGFFDTPVDIILSKIDDNYDIYYTTNGLRPSATTGTKYSSPLIITTTTVISAVCIDKTSSIASEIISNTYIFAEDVLKQPGDPTGYPENWDFIEYDDGFPPADYEMDPEICTNSNKIKLIEGLKSLPVISIVTNPGYIFSGYPDADTGGIYIFTGDCGYPNNSSIGRDWERPVSLEYFDPDTTLNFQINCGLRLHGGNSRKPGNSPKHSFRVSFRSIYGPSRLNFNFFDEKSATNEFNSLVFRAGYNYSWVKNSPAQCEGTDFMKDPFAKNTQLDMDRLSAHNKFVHLYINGLYWGVYNISEKVTNDFIESYLGGNEDDYDVVSDHFGVIDGNRTAWEKLIAINNDGLETIDKYMEIQGKDPDGSVNQSYDNLLDVRNLVDYMIMNFYIANMDWDHNNWYAVRNRVTNEYGFRFFAWDAETSMDDLYADIVDENNSGNPSDIYSELRNNEEFRLFFADRIQKHFFNGGTLTSESATERYIKMADKLDLAIMAESARWGDYRRDVSPATLDYDLYTRDEHWINNVNYMKDTYFQQRTDIVFDQLKDIGLYPDINPPIFSHYGGNFYGTLNVGISSDEGTIYFTTDNTDPREPGGAIAVGSAIEYTDSLTFNQDTIIKARVKIGNDWSALVRVKYDHKKNPVQPYVEPIFIASVVKSTAYPNPFGNETSIEYILPVSDNVKVSIASMDGQIIEVLYNDIQTQGVNRIYWSPQNISSGLYYYIIQCRSNIYTGKLIYQK